MYCSCQFQKLAVLVLNIIKSSLSSSLLLSLFCVCVIPTCIPDSHPHRITSTKCHINIVISPDDGHIVTQNMWRLINILRINCASSWSIIYKMCYDLFDFEDIVHQEFVSLGQMVKQHYYQEVL